MTRSLRDSGPALQAGGLVTVTLLAVFGIMLAFGVIKPIDLLAAGSRGPSAQIISEDFGPLDNPRTGYDGQQVYVIARFFPDLTQAESSLDDPAYRATRILQPALASPAPDGIGLVVALLVLGCVGVGLAVAAMTDLAIRHRRDPRIGLVAAPILLLPVAIGTTEPLAYGLAFAAVALLDRRRTWAAVALGIAAVLTRETAVLVLGLAVLGALPTQRWRALPVAVVPAGALLVWMAVVAAWLPGANPSRFEILGVRHLSVGGVVVVAVIVVAGVAGAWMWRDVPTLWPVSLGFGLFPLILRPEVLDILALPRVAAPALILGLTGAVGHRRAPIPLEAS